MSEAIYMDTDQVAEMLGVSPRTLEDWRYRGGGPPYCKLGRSVRYMRHKVIAWSEGHEQAHTSQESA